jgi:hypothetical protein
MSPLQIVKLSHDRGYAKAKDKSTGRKVYLSVGNAPLSKTFRYLHRASKTADAASAYAQRFEARMRRMVGAKVTHDIWKSMPWYVKIWAKVREWRWKRTRGH